MSPCTEALTTLCKMQWTSFITSITTRTINSPFKMVRPRNSNCPIQAKRNKSHRLWGLTKLRSHFFFRVKYSLLYLYCSIDLKEQRLFTMTYVPPWLEKSRAMQLSITNHANKLRPICTLPRARMIPLITSRVNSIFLRLFYLYDSHLWKCYLYCSHK